MAGLVEDGYIFTFACELNLLGCVVLVEVHE